MSCLFSNNCCGAPTLYVIAGFSHDKVAGALAHVVCIIHILHQIHQRFSDVALRLLLHDHPHLRPVAAGVGAGAVPVQDPVEESPGLGGGHGAARPLGLLPPRRPPLLHQTEAAAAGDPSPESGARAAARVGGAGQVAHRVRAPLHVVPQHGDLGVGVLQAEVGVKGAVVEVDLIEVSHPLLDVRGRISVENLQIQSNFRSSNAFRYKSTLLN